MSVSLSHMYLYLNPFKRIGTDRLNLHDFSDRLKNLEVQVEADDAYGWCHCGCVVSASIFVDLYRPVSLSMSLSINAGHLKQHAAPVKRSKESGRRSNNYTGVN